MRDTIQEALSENIGNIGVASPPNKYPPFASAGKSMLLIMCFNFECTLQAASIASTIFSRAYRAESILTSLQTVHGLWLADLLT